MHESTCLLIFCSSVYIRQCSALSHAAGSCSAVQGCPPGTEEETVAQVVMFGSRRRRSGRTRMGTQTAWRETPAPEGPWPGGGLEAFLHGAVGFLNLLLCCPDVCHPEMRFHRMRFLWCSGAPR